MTKKELLLEMQNRRDIGEYVGSGEALLCIFHDDEEVPKCFINAIFSNKEYNIDDYSFEEESDESFKFRIKKILENFMKNSIN